MNENKPLTFEEFSEWEGENPKYESFPFYFVNNIGNTMREKKHFKRFAKENSSLERELTLALTRPILEHGSIIRIAAHAIMRGESVREPKTRKEILKPHEKKLYEAYLAMRKYVKSDSELSTGLGYR